MSERKSKKGIAKGFLGFTRLIFNIGEAETPSFLDKFYSAVVLVFVLGVLSLWAGGAVALAWESYIYDHLSPGEHLARAKAACGGGSVCLDTSEAVHHLSGIQTAAPEYGEASRLRTAINQQEAHDEEQATQKSDEAKQKSREQMQRNFKGEAQDRFSCATSTENQPIVSFDDGRFWWKDDGRCGERMQKKRDEDAQIHSYWSTTVRVNTDMDSFWLPDEERTCQTSPDDKGRVATVTCDATAHAIHNIPVEFWGGVERNAVSNWKCRREKDIFQDQFVCRAID